MKRKQRFFKLSALVGCILLGVGIVMGSAGFVAMGCDLDAFTYPRGGEPVAVSSFVVEDAVDSIEIHASMGDVKIERASAANPEDVEIILAEKVYEVVVQHGLLLVMPQDSYTATGQGLSLIHILKRGYVFDGSGLWYRDKPLEQYAPCAADDDLVLYLSKKLVRREFRPLTKEELVPELFRCFDRFQIVEKCWRKVEGQWVVKDVVFTERWGEEDYRFLCQCLQNTVATGGQVWGAFLEGRLKGFASVEGPLIGSQKQYADLTSIHVSADARGPVSYTHLDVYKRQPMWR